MERHEMTPVRRAEIEARIKCIEALRAQAGSMRAAAKLAEMDRSSFYRLWRTRHILTPPAPARTN
jgi:transcriptional regulator of acetoin/glycerol metabolism